MIVEMPRGQVAFVAACPRHARHSKDQLRSARGCRLALPLFVDVLLDELAEESVDPVALWDGEDMLPSLLLDVLLLG